MATLTVKVLRIGGMAPGGLELRGDPTLLEKTAQRLHLFTKLTTLVQERGALAVQIPPYDGTQGGTAYHVAEAVAHILLAARVPPQDAEGLDPVSSEALASLTTGLPDTIGPGRVRLAPPA